MQSTIHILMYDWWYILKLHLIKTTALETSSVDQSFPLELGTEWIFLIFRQNVGHFSPNETRAMQFARIPRDATSKANDFVKASVPALLAA